MKCTKLYLTVAVLLAAAVRGQPAPPGAPAGLLIGPAAPVNDGIPLLQGRPDEDGPGIVMGKALLPDQVPKPSVDPKNFEGSWHHSDSFQGRTVRTIIGTRLPYTDQAKQILKHRREMENAGTPVANASAKCYPTIEFALEINAPFYIVQKKDSLYFFFEEFHEVWQVRMDRQHKLSEPRNIKGDSIGYWDGNTLVIETLGYRDPFWLDAAGTPASKDARITRRMRKISDGQTFEIITTINDPQMYKEPWSFARTFGWSPDKWMTGEYNCEQQVGSKTGAASYGVVEEATGSR